MRALLFVVLPIAMATQVTVPPEVARFAAPVLNAHALVAQHDEPRNEAVLAHELAKVLDTHTPAANEALAVLLGFYVGEASGEDISCELVARGAVVVPLLHRYARDTIEVPGADTSQLRRMLTQYAIVERRINSGERCVREK